MGGGPGIAARQVMSNKLIQNDEEVVFVAFHLVRKTRKLHMRIPRCNISNCAEASSSLASSIFLYTISSSARGVKSSLTRHY